MVQVHTLFDKATSTLTYIVYDPATRDAVVIDPVLDFDPASGRTDQASAQAVAAFVKEQALRLHFILETHAHADHLSGAQVLRQNFPKAQLAIGARITDVQTHFKRIFGLPQAFATDGRQFDHLVTEGETLLAGSLTVKVLYTPGHTPACVSYVIGDTVFTGDTLFMPDYGTGRCDFPGGSAAQLYKSITERLYTLPDQTRTFTGHDYQPGGRPLRYEATIGEQKRSNIHLNAETTQAAFVKFRAERDATLSFPRLLFASIQVNIAGGHLPEPEVNGLAYLKLPLNATLM